MLHRGILTLHIHSHIILFANFQAGLVESIERPPKMPYLLHETKERNIETLVMKIGLVGFEFLPFRQITVTSIFLYIYFSETFEERVRAPLIDLELFLIAFSHSSLFMLSTLVPENENLRN